MEKISIQELNGLFANRTKLSEEEADRLVKAMFSIISDEIAKGNPVKVRGLGTFKIVDVDARESVNVNTGERVLIEGHGKLTFIPDATMKEIVNRPFSQFETVVLNDGVDFSDEEDEDSDKPVTEEPVVQVVEIPTVEEPQIDVDVPEEETVVQEDTEPIAEVEPETESLEETSVPAHEEPASVEEEPIPTEEEPDTTETVDKEVEQISGDSHGHWVNTLLWTLLWIVVVGVSAFVGYLYGANEANINKALSEMFGSKPAVTVERRPAPKPAPKKPVAKPVTVNVEVESENQKTKPAKDQSEEVDYASLDSRVRTGAYRIVGTEAEVTVKSGETLKTISDRALGPGMECYVEVYNGLSDGAELKEGRKLKIPKLELKSHKRK